MRRPFIVANWKMNPTPLPFGAASRGEPSTPYHTRGDVDVIVLPTFLDLQTCIEAKLAVGAQWGHPDPMGAYTGDVSMKMLKKIGCSFVLCGHSERRQYHREGDDFVRQQACSALEEGMHPIVCVGETAKERKDGRTKEVIKEQLEGMPHGDITIAYEPRWAIGTGVNALPKDAEDVHAFIRSLLPGDAREHTRILYGGSANDLNAPDLLKEEDIDGLLVGGASLKPEVFGAIVEIAAVRRLGSCGPQA